MKKEQFYSMYANWWMRKIIRCYVDRGFYKHWNNWCFRGGNGLYCFKKGYDEDYAKNNVR